MTTAGAGLLLSSIVCTVIGVMSIAIAFRECERGSAAWAWLLPGMFGAILVVGCLVRLVVVAT